MAAQARGPKSSFSIRYVVHSGLETASTRLRIAIPARELDRMGHDIRLDGDADVVVFGKHFSREDAALIKQVKGKTIFDICDDHFATKHTEHYKQMCYLADAVTCSTEAMQDRILQETRREASVIQDPYDFAEQVPRKMPERPRLIWHGHATNFDTLREVIADLVDWRLTVVSNKDPNLVRYRVTWIPWSYDGVQEQLGKHDIAIVPTIDQPRKRVKSPNRVVDAIRCGCFVVAGHHPSYEQFSEVAWIGDIREGIEWAIQHPREAMRKTLQGQKLVRKNFSPTKIAEQWETAFASILDADQSHKRDTSTSISQAAQA